MYGNRVIDGQQMQADHIQRVLGLKWANSPDLHRSLFWFSLQRTYKCCGLTNATDWTERVPDSCCEPLFPNYVQTIDEEYMQSMSVSNSGGILALDECAPPEIYRTGCARALVSQAFQWSRFLNTYAYCIAFAGMLGCILAYSCGPNQKKRVPFDEFSVEVVEKTPDLVRV